MILKTPDWAKQSEDSLVLTSFASHFSGQAFVMWRDCSFVIANLAAKLSLTPGFSR
jgi:hypothetical protein